MFTSMVWSEVSQTEKKKKSLKYLVIYENLLIMRLFLFKKSQEMSLKHNIMLSSPCKFSSKVYKLGRRNGSKKCVHSFVLLQHF